MRPRVLERGSSTRTRSAAGRGHGGEEDTTVLYIMIMMISTSHLVNKHSVC